MVHNLKLYSFFDLSSSLHALSYIFMVAAHYAEKLCSFKIRTEMELRSSGTQCVVMRS